MRTASFGKRAEFAAESTPYEVTGGCRGGLTPRSVLLVGLRAFCVK